MYPLVARTGETDRITAVPFLMNGSTVDDELPFLPDEAAAATATI